MIFLWLTIPFAGNEMLKLFPVRFRHLHCCVIVTMRPRAVIMWAAALGLL